MKPPVTLPSFRELGERERERGVAKLSLKEFVTWLIRTNAATSIDFITVLCKSRVEAG